ncbi:hypothetical protein N0V88_005800 [Collariella sp. IMI 366227]|nr:hypothetical protein N0V88_005800 [Collariella sp. IMI 366227]
MVQLIPGVTVPAPVPRRADPLSDLTVLLNRLQRTILHADAERETRLRNSEFERQKAQANINHARSLLTRLEQEALAVKILARRQETQADLVRKRETLDQLSERLSDLAEFAAARDNGDGDEDTSDGEDILADIIPTPSESLASTKSPDMPPENTTALTTTTEAILDHQRAEQDALSESILKLATQLKASSHAISASLEEDKEVVERAGQA